MRMYMAVRYNQQQDWRKKLQLLGNIEPPAVTWPKTKTVSWETLPSLVLQLDKYGLLSPHLKSKNVHAWDPLFYNGKVKATWKRVGISVEHSCENFWKVWYMKISPKSVIITNPPFRFPWAILWVSYRTWSAVPTYSTGHCSQSTLLRKISLRPNSETQWVKHLCASEIFSNEAEGRAFGRLCRSYDLHLLSQTLELRVWRNEVWAIHSNKITPLNSTLNKIFILKKKKKVTSDF